MKFDNQLRYAVTIVSSYRGEMPLHAWLKNFFRENKQMGSKDRRLVSNMVYGFYRLGHALRGLPAQDRILLGLFLCNEAPGELLQYFRPAWNEQINLPLEEKIRVCRSSGLAFEPAEIFPWKDELSEAIDHEAFCLSFLRQPDLFLRIRPGYEKEVLGKLSPASAPYEFIPPFTLRLPNGFKVEEWWTPDKEVVVQDYSSQRIASFLQLSPVTAGASPSVARPAPAFWDACAASGGKSILAFDLNPGIDITVSDIRESILRNLHHRFRSAGIGKYHSFVADLAVQPNPSGSRQGASAELRVAYDLILADVPCSGSGTWSRTPEELYFFDPKKIGYYSGLQKNIVSNILPRLSKGASLVYSTCSVFKKENESMAALIRDAYGLQQDRMETIKGYDLRADSMFAARFTA